MDLMSLVSSINNFLALPSTIIFISVAIILTLKHKFLQFRGFPRFVYLVTQGLKPQTNAGNSKTINPFHALFTAMGTTLGMGNIVGPSIAILVGGPGALFWLVCYAFFASATKYTEVVLALNTRLKLPSGDIIGGPMQYLRLVSSAIATWYGIAMIFLMVGWSGLQANTLASIFAQESIPHWMTGAGLAIIVFMVLNGGAQRIGLIASKLVPLMSILYIVFAFTILIKNPAGLRDALLLIGSSIFSPCAAIGGFMGATIMQAVRAGTYKSIFITEAGLGTSSIPHAIADVQQPTDQGILAMFSMAADAFLSFLSGLLALVTGLWIDSGFSNTIMYEVFKLNSPVAGRFVLLITISLFVLTTAIGNSFNGSQNFASFTRHRWIQGYNVAAVAIIFLGSLMNVPLIWNIMDVVLTFVAIPNLIGVVILAFRKPAWFKI